MKKARISNIYKQSKQCGETPFTAKAHERANWRTRSPNGTNRQGERRGEGSEGADARAKKGRMESPPDPTRAKSRQRQKTSHVHTSHETHMQEHGPRGHKRPLKKTNYQQNAVITDDDLESATLGIRDFAASGKNV